MRIELGYVCQECGRTNYIFSLLTWFFTPHLGAKKLLKCPHCGAGYHFMARKDGRKWLDWYTEKK